jgi:hypothetical protein
MKTKRLAVTLGVMALSILLANGFQSEVQPVLAAHGLFTALNSGDPESALNSFAPGATVENRISGVTYLDADQITAMLETWSKDGRQYTILEEEVTYVTRGLDLVTSEVEITDHGVVWRETLMAVVQDDQIQKLYLKNVQLTPSQDW